MRRLIYLLPLIILFCASARANQSATGWCETGAQVVVTNGLNSTTQVQGSFPQCLVQVLIHGAGPATIFADNNNTVLANPFTANTVGQWQFYAANGHYDVVLSGSGFPSPVTISDVLLDDPAAPNTYVSPTITNPTITGTVAGGATYVLPLFTSPTSSGTDIGTETLNNKTLVSPIITGTVSGGASYASPTITGTVSGGASYTAPTITSPVVTGTMSGSRTDTGALTATGIDTIQQLNGSQVAGPTGQTIGAAITAAGTNNVIHISPGTYTIAAALAPLAGQRLLCDDGATITQGSATNLTSLIDFSANSANGASIQNCILDGNRAANTDTAGRQAINIGAANDVTVFSNTIQNVPGSAVAVTTGLRPTIRANKLKNLYQYGVIILTGVSQTATHGIIDGNTCFNTVSFHCFAIADSDYDQITNNEIQGFQSIQTVNTSGTAVTYNSGTNFAGLTPGMFMSIAGTEYFISAVASNMALTLSTSAGSQSGAAAISGTGDLIGIDSSSHAIVSGNTLLFGMAIGISLSNTTGPEALNENLVYGNRLVNQGQAGIAVQSAATGVSGNTIKDNYITDAGQGGAANSTTVNCGIALIGTNTLGTSLIGNDSRDDQGGSATQQYGICMSSMGNGSVFASANTLVGNVNNGIQNAITSIALSGGWGSTAGVTAIVSYGESFGFTVTSAGTGQGANPTITITTRAVGAINPPQWNCKQVGGNDVLGLTDGEFGATASVFTLSWIDTPTATKLYDFSCR